MRTKADTCGQHRILVPSRLLLVTHLLDIVAQYADIKTMQLLTSAEHLRARTDELYLQDHYCSLLAMRKDNSEKLEDAFEELLSVLRMDAAAQADLMTQMEAGLSHQALSEKDTDSDCSSFEDAREQI